MRTVRILSRDSELAVKQAELVAESITQFDRSIEPRLITMKTTGDKLVDLPLDKAGGKGLFVKELDIALLEGRGDISVHSYKDMPVEDNPEMPVVAVSRREDARDALVLPQGMRDIDFSKPIGCSSARRAIQLKSIYPDAEIAPVRGNVPTRLRKLDSGEYSALVLASAGIKRLGLANRINRLFSPEEILPAACQGIIAVQARAGEDVSYLELFNDDAAAICSRAERAYISQLGAGCFSPVAVYARPEGDKLKITGMYVGDDEAVRFDDRLVTRDEAIEAARDMARGFLNL
jgi:hydroxymethylbilane synthase